jgi:hypothetical protein
MELVGRRAFAAVAVIALVVMLAAALSGLARHFIAAGTALPGTAWTGGGATCALGSRQADVQLQVTEMGSCGNVQRDLQAADGLGWYLLPRLSGPGKPGSDGLPLTLVCALSWQGSRLTVLDSAEAGAGPWLCSQERQQGWRG